MGTRGGRGLYLKDGYLDCGDVFHDHGRGGPARRDSPAALGNRDWQAKCPWVTEMQLLLRAANLHWETSGFEPSLRLAARSDRPELTEPGPPARRPTAGLAASLDRDSGRVAACEEQRFGDCWTRARMRHY